jgi:hypothetical protein
MILRPAPLSSLMTIGGDAGVVTSLTVPQNEHVIVP